MIQYPKDFLLAICRQHIQEKHVRINVLDFYDNQLQEVSGLCTGGTINITGQSSTRRTANLTFLYTPETGGIVDINNIFAVNKKIILSIGISNVENIPFNNYLTNQSEVPPIVWFPQGEYYITQASTNMQAGGNWAISLNLIDGSAQLNGTVAGTFPATTVLHKSYNIADNGDLIVQYPTIRQIIFELVTHFGNIHPAKVIIKDLPDTGSWVWTYAGSTPLYMTVPNPYSTSYTFTNDGVQNLVTIPQGEKVGYLETPLEYPGELIQAAGSTVAAALDTICTTLGNYNWYFDLDSNFVFEYREAYNKTESIPLINLQNPQVLTIADYLPSYSSTQYTDEFMNADLIQSLSLNPQYQNIKNDFIVWGSIGQGDKARQVRYHVAIDKKPKLHTGTNTLPTWDAITNQYISDPYYDSLSTKYYWTIKKVLEDGSLGETLYYRFTNNNTPPPVQAGQNIDMTCSPCPPTYGAGNPFGADVFEWREELYRQALMRWNSSGGKGDYDEELIAEWRLIFDPLSNNAFFTAQAKDTQLSFEQQWTDSAAYWNTFGGSTNYKNWGPWRGFSPNIIENIDRMNYWLDILDNEGEIGQYSIERIGKRTQVVQKNTVDSVFNVSVPDVDWIENPGDAAAIQNIASTMAAKGQQWCLFLPEHAEFFLRASFFGSCFEEVRNQILTHLVYNTSITMQCIPLPYMDVNKLLYLAQADQSSRSSMAGYYQIDTITQNLAFNGNQSITAHAASLII